MNSFAYSKSQRILDSLALLLLGSIYYIPTNHLIVNISCNDALFFLIPIVCFLAALCADFVSGFVHFLGDHPVIDNKWLNKYFYPGFRNHHLDPIEMTQHSMIETNGLNALGACIVLIPSFFYYPKPDSLMSFSLYLFILFFSLMVSLTNQIHKWAHTTHPPILVKLLQNMRLILNPRNHIQHHIAHDKYYCITTGWLNYFCYKTKIWERLTGIKIKN